MCTVWIGQFEWKVNVQWTCLFVISRGLYIWQFLHFWRIHNWHLTPIIRWAIQSLWYLQKQCISFFFLLRGASYDQRIQTHTTAPPMFRYMREMAVKKRMESNFYCLDYKSKIPFGEPGTVMATGVRGRRTLVPSTTTLGAADHDQNSKGNL